MLASRSSAFTSFTVDKQHERYERVWLCVWVCICMCVSLLVWSEASSNKALPSGSFGDRVHHHHTHTSPCQLALHTTHGLKISCNITVTHTNTNMYQTYVHTQVAWIAVVGLSYSGPPLKCPFFSCRQSHTLKLDWQVELQALYKTIENQNYYHWTVVNAAEIHTHLHAHAHFCSSGGHMTSSELPSDVSKGLWKLNFIDKVADDGKQRTFLVVTNENSLFFHSFLILVWLSLSPHYKPQKHRTYQNIFHNSFWLFALFHIGRKWMTI